MDGQSASTRDRSTYLGGSDIAAVCGFGGFRNELDVWAAKVGNYDPAVGPEAEVGQVYEAPTVELYRRRMNVPPEDTLDIFGTLVDPHAPWAGATPDRVRVLGLAGSTCINVQVKIVGEHMTRHWGSPAMAPESVPIDVLAQCTWEARAIEAAIPGLTVVEQHVVANLGGTNVVTFPFAYDRDFADLLFARAEAWWKRHVIGREMPEITEENAESARAIFGHFYPRETLPMLEPGHEHLELARAYDRARSELKAAEAKRDTCAARLIHVIGESAGFESDDERIRVTYKTTKKGVRSLDVKVKE